MPVVMVDCSHANCGKRFARQERVLQAVVQQKRAGDETIIGVMLESNLFEGNQKIPEDPGKLRYCATALLRYCATGCRSRMSAWAGMTRSVC